MKTEIFPITGMHCASCSVVIKKRIQKLPGIEDIQVNYGTEKATITYDPNLTTVQDMNTTIQQFGYTLGTENKKNTAIKSDGVNVAFSLPIALLIFILMIWDSLSTITPFLPKIPLPMNIMNALGFILSLPMLFWIGQPYLRGILRFVTTKTANMDTLIGIGTTAAFFYSAFLFLFPGAANFLQLPSHTYFDVPIVVIGFVTLGKYLEAKAKAQTGNAIQKLLELQPKTATRIQGEIQEIVPILSLQIGDLVRIRTGEKIPLDGTIVQGSGSIDESMITGEPLPLDKTEGDTVIGGTINTHGHLTVQITKTGEKTVLSQIIAFVEKAQGTKSPIEKKTDAIAAVFVPIVLIIALVSFILWLTIGTSILGFTLAFSYGLLCTIGVLVIACPCALGLATPTAIIVGMGKAAQRGILFKDAESIERLEKITTVVFDKTGTITNGTPTITDIISLQTNKTEDTLLTLAGSLEQHSLHPLAIAITNKAKDKHLQLYSVSDIHEQEGFGIEGTVEKQHILIRKAKTKELLLPQAKQLVEAGKTIVLVEINKKIAGIFALSDTIKHGVYETIQKLHKRNIETILLTGDHERAARTIASQAGITTIRANILPQEKAAEIQKLQKNGERVAFVGDGINDAPALTQADAGIAVSNGTDIAIESASVVFLVPDIQKVAEALRLSKQIVRTMKQNLLWAFFYNIIGIPVAAGILYPLLGIVLHPALAGLAMAGSSVSVITNSLLLKRKPL